MNQKSIKNINSKEGDLLSCTQEDGHLINQAIVQILVEKDNPEEVKELMRAELDYNKERLAILREHAQLNPDNIEDRKAKGFRRIQYGYLMLFLSCLLPAIYFLKTGAAITLSGLAMMIAAAIIVNGRDRDNDSELMVKLIDKIIKSTRK